MNRFFMYTTVAFNKKNKSKLADVWQRLGTSARNTIPYIPVCEDVSTDATPSMPSTVEFHSSTGFTLIEVLVVLIIMGIIVSFISLSVSIFTNTSKAKEMATNLIEMIKFAEQQAILQPAQIGIVFNNNTYSFYQFVINENTQLNQWKEITGITALKTQMIPKNLNLTISTPKSTENLLTDREAIQPKIIIFSSGEITPFTINISVNHKLPLYRIIGYQQGNLRMIKINDTHDSRA